MQSQHRYGTADVAQKYTVQSNGIWERLRRMLAVDPERSTGVPLNPQYRNPPPGANPPQVYDDPVSVPSGDLAENSYYKRDIRRNYPRLSVVQQNDVMGLLSFGSKIQPKENALKGGDAGEKQLIAFRRHGEDKGLAFQLDGNMNAKAGILGPNNLPPFPSGMSRASLKGVRQYTLDGERVEGYPEQYVERRRDCVRTGSNVLLVIHVARSLEYSKYASFTRA